MGEVPAYLLHALTYSLTTDDGPLLRRHSGKGYNFTEPERRMFNQTAQFMLVTMLMLTMSMRLMTV